MNKSYKTLLIGLMGYTFLWGLINSHDKLSIPPIELGPAKVEAAGGVSICKPGSFGSDSTNCANVINGALSTTASLSLTGVTITAGTTSSIVDTNLANTARVLPGGALSVGTQSTMPLNAVLGAGTSTIGSFSCLNCSTLSGTVTVAPAAGVTFSTNQTFVGHIILDSGTVTTLTNPLPAGTNVIGHIILDSGSVTVTQGTGTNLRTVMDSGTLTSITNALPTGANTIGIVNQGTGAAAANAWAAFVTDGAGHTNSTTYPLIVLQGQTTAGGDSVKAFTADGVGNAITSSVIGTRTMIDVACSGCAAASAVSINAGSNIMGAVTQSGAFTVDVVKIAGTTTATGNGVTGAGSQRVTIASDNTAFGVNATLQAGSAVIGHIILDSGTITTLTGITNALPAGTNLMGKVGIDQTTPGTTNGVVLNSGSNVIGHVILDSGTVTSLTQFNGQAIALNTGARSAGTLRVTIATDDIVPASQSGTWTVQPGNTANTTPWLMTPVPATSGGWTFTHGVSAASVNAMNIKASAGQIGGWYIYNSNAAARKIAFHNTAGVPTAGSGVVFTIIVPPTSAANVNISEGLAFATGIAMTTVTELTDAGNTAVAASDLIWSIWYK